MHEALADTEELRMMWHHSRQHPTAPAFSGGVLDSWPAVAVDGFAILDHELLMINAYREQLRTEKRNG